MDKQRLRNIKDKIFILFLKSYNYLLSKDRQVNLSFSRRKNEHYKRWWLDAVTELSAEITAEGFGFDKISKEGRHTFIKSELVMVDSGLQLDMAGDKPLTYKILKNLGLPIPTYIEYQLSNMQAACELVESKDQEFVAKPCFGTGGGKGVTTGITDAKKLRQASYIAASYCNRLMLEEFITGSSYRLLYLEGQFVDAIRRDPPHIQGDGHKRIEELIADINITRLSSSQAEAINPLLIDMDLKQTLHSQGLSLSSVLAKKQIVRVKQVINQNSRQENHRVTEQVHSSIIEQGKKVVGYFGLQLAGVDVITEDISLPLKEGNGYINEINTTPGLHLHKLIANPEQSYPVFYEVLKYLLTNGIKSIN